MRSECKEGLYVACIDVESMLQQRYAFMIMMNINSYPLVPVMRSSSIPFYSFQSSCITTYICDGLRRVQLLCIYCSVVTHVQPGAFHIFWITIETSLSSFYIPLHPLNSRFLRFQTLSPETYLLGPHFLPKIKPYLNSLMR